MKLIPLKVFNILRGIFVLIYGRPSVGKTFFGGTADAPILFLHTGERGLRVLGERDDVWVFDIKDCASALTIFAEIGKDPEIHKKIKTIVVDSIHCLRDMKVQELGGIPNLKEWGIVSSFVLKCINYLIPLLDKGINIILIAHHKADDPQSKDKKKRYIPAGGESLAQMLAGRADVVGYMNKEEVQTFDPKTKKMLYKEEVVMHIDACEEYYCRARVDHRTHKIPKKIVNPVWNDLKKIFFNSNQGEKS